MKFIYSGTETIPENTTILLCTPEVINLPSLPQGLQKLNCSYGSISILPHSHSQITNLPDLPQGLQALICNNTQITSLPASLPQGLKVLDCSYSKIKNLPVSLPNSLQELICSCTEIKSLPASLPSCLHRLDFWNTRITSLPALPQSLRVLRYSDIDFDKLPILPQNLQCLYCDTEVFPSDNKIHIFRTLQELAKEKERVKKLENEIKRLQEQILIMPGGEDYFKAMAHYKQLREQALDKN